MQSEQKQEQQQHPSAIDTHAFKKVTCSAHGYRYLYKCLYSACDKYICGKIQCIDQHFHENQLQITKIDANLIISKLEHLQKVDSFINKINSTLEHYRVQINSMKDTSTRIFSLYKKQKQIISYLQSKHERLDNEYFNKLSTLEELNENLQAEINAINSRINWKNIWTTIGSQFDIVQKLKLDFKELSHLYLESKNLNIEQLDQRWTYTDYQNEPNQGLAIVYFTKQNFIVGEYIGNKNVETGFLFIDSFIFVIDPEGTIYKDKISDNILEYKDNYYSPHEQSDILFHLNLKINLESNQEHNKAMQMELKVTRVESFQCTR